ncbi:MAG TPA: hypothetical protein VG737_07520 [Cyclobacteriaceae bacterium]|nr:hypothetical protein [Cyclobacteriaceae bacterium]
MRITVQQVESFLRDFRARMAEKGVVFTNSTKNSRGIFDLEITPAMRNKILMSLKATDYYRGPSMQSGWVGEAWEFGKAVNNKIAYIKVSMGVKKTAAQPDQKVVAVARPVICISFHEAEKEITYPFKK